MPETTSLKKKSAMKTVAARKAQGGVTCERSRAMIYSLLSQALSSPSAMLCDAVQEGIFFELVKFAIARTAPAHRRMIAAGLVKSFSPAAHQGRFAEDVMIEYTRLFSANLQCLQYEADYLGRNADNSVHVIAAIAGMYSTFGVRVTDGAGERPDHIAVELDFMNHLSSREAYALEKDQTENALLCRDAQAHFFSRHLSRWATSFADNLAEATTLPFYRSVCELLHSFLKAEGKYLGVVLSQPPTDSEIKAAERCGCSHCGGESMAKPGGLTQFASPGKETTLVDG
jgi:putative dimethyl sulfoxide reductase chaperone